MEAIIKTLLLEGIDEATIHRVLDVIEEEYEVISELDDNTKFNCGRKRIDNLVGEVNKFAELKKAYPTGSNATVKDKTDNMMAQTKQEKI